MDIGRIVGVREVRLAPYETPAGDGRSEMKMPPPRAASRPSRSAHPRSDEGLGGSNSGDQAECS